MASSVAIYRRLLRSAAQAFGADAPMLAAARQELRGRFEAARDEADVATLEQLRADGLEAANFLASAVVGSPLDAAGRASVAAVAGAQVEPVLPGMELPREDKKARRRD